MNGDIFSTAERRALLSTGKRKHFPRVAYSNTVTVIQIFVVMRRSSNGQTDGNSKLSLEKLSQCLISPVASVKTGGIKTAHNISCAKTRSSTSVRNVLRYLRNVREIADVVGIPKSRTKKTRRRVSLLGCDSRCKNAAN
ncbi:hypothetical protein Zmor_013497 [Zophobas morio]|uniref:Uncharacterized protein n=1 Tax=Zophobas morio TaxID=2755281 RepID=A0AA38IFL6_9CUCU|nr:hypothetical protein Zmor_013497 [Zophobas morio]